MKPIDTNGALEALAKIKDTVKALQDRYADLEQQRKTLLLRNHDLYMKPLMPQDIRALMITFIDQRAQAYLASGVARKAFSTFCEPSSDTARLTHDGSTGSLRASSSVVGALNLADALQLSGHGGSIAGNFGTAGFDLFPVVDGGSSDRFYFFFGDLVKKKIELLFSTFTRDVRLGSADGLSIDERKREIDANSAKVEQIEADIIAIVDQLHGLGVHAARLPSTMSVAKFG